MIDSSIISIDEYQSLKRFLLTGDLGSVSFKSSRNDVLKILGLPVEERISNTAVPQNLLTVLDYGNLEFIFIESTMYMVAIYFHDFRRPKKFIEFPKNLEVDWYENLQNSPYEGFIRYLKDAQIEARQIVIPGEPNDTGYSIEISQSKTHVVFDEDAKLYSIIYAPFVNSKHNYKNLS